MAHQTDTLTQPIPMPRHTHLLRRASRYYLNVKVPKDLRKVFKKEIIRKALNTSDPHEAAGDAAAILGTRPFSISSMQAVIPS